jgi:hypothetical protein
LKEEFSWPFPKKKGFAEPWGSWEADQGLVALERKKGEASI